jgi:hypothetical protein
LLFLAAGILWTGSDLLPAAADPTRSGDSAHGVTETRPTLIPISGTHVSLPLPPGFVPARGFAGIQQVDGSATVMVSEKSGAFAYHAQGMTAGSLSSKGMVLVDKWPIMVGDVSGLLVQAFRTTNGMSQGKWLLIFGNDQDTVFITATYPRSQVNPQEEKALSLQLRSMLLGTVWHPPGHAVPGPNPDAGKH